jgi:hypothetical protein
MVSLIFTGETLVLYHCGGRITTIKQFNPAVGTLVPGGPTGYVYKALRPGYDLIMLVDEYNELPVSVLIICMGGKLLHSYAPLDAVTGDPVALQAMADATSPFYLFLSNVSATGLKYTVEHPHTYYGHLALGTAQDASPTSNRGGSLESSRSSPLGWMTSKFRVGDIVCPDGANAATIPTGTSDTYLGWTAATLDGSRPDNTVEVVSTLIGADSVTDRVLPPTTVLRLVTCSAALAVSTSDQKLTVTLSEEYLVDVLVYLRAVMPPDYSGSTPSGSQVNARKTFGPLCPIASRMFVKKSGTVYELDLSKTTYDIPVGYTDGLMVQVRGSELGESYTIEMPNAILRTVMGAEFGKAPVGGGVDNVPPATDGPILKP